MSFTDKQLKDESKVLEGLLEKKDYTGLHNRLVHDAQITSKDEFNKVVGMMNDMNKEARKTNSGLPEMQIHNDGWFGTGSTDQIVLHDTNSDRKMEIFESQAHRQNEEAEMQNQAQPYQMDVLRNAEKASGKWVGAPDFQKDSADYWQQEKVQSAPAYVIRDFREQQANNSRDFLHDLQQRVNSGEKFQSNSDFHYEKKR